MVRRGWVKLVVGLAVLLTTAAVGTVLAYPAVGATMCPGCYGLGSLTPRVYVERGLSVAQRHQVAEVVEEAGRRVHELYGGRTSSPRVLACLTERCYDRIGGGGERGVAVLNRAVMLSPRGIDPVIASHEMAHVELHRRLESDGEQVPQWFDEGLAVLISDDPRYLAPRAAPDRCLVSSEGALPVTLAEWLREASADQRVYARSACRVSRWLDANGGRAALLDLITRLGAGETFPMVVKN